MFFFAASCSGTSIKYNRLKCNLPLHTHLYRTAPTDLLRLQLTAQEAAGIVYLFPHERNSLFGDKKKKLSNQQLLAPHGHFCANLLSDCKEFNPDHIFCPTLARSAFKIYGALGILLEIIYQI